MPDQSEATAGIGETRAASIVHRPRALAPRPLWLWSDLAIAGSLAALLPVSWLLPEHTWSLLCRALARVPGLADRAMLGRTAGIIRAVLNEPAERAAAIACDLQAAVYELRMQNLRAWRPGGWRPNIALDGEDHLLRARARGKGAVLWVAHFAFNSNITKIALHRRGYPVSHLSRPEHGFSKTRLGIALLNQVRCIPEDRCLARRIVFDRSTPQGAMRAMMRRLQAGDIVSITAGAWEGTDLAEGPLLGGRLAVALGAPRLAALTGAELLPVFSVRDPKVGFRTVIEPPIALPAGRRPEERCAAATAEYLRRHEYWVRTFPDQWRGWKEWRRA
ncbi:MAG TPA: lysophospholipid acyltransferase family protein [Dongiaceae bacterium]|nr:lysophospholipid acyltransferase family protein [Dongiaceae bacterium]